ncbi:MAG: cytochrome c oxidase subunit 2 [Candidatus Marinamargulisbacteria bacterium]|jgi:cytochrome c oxidase subunit 2
MNSVKVESLMDNGTLWFPRSVSTVSDSVDLLYYVILWGSVIGFVGILLVCLYFTFRYRRSDQNPKAKEHITENLTLELTWTVVPLILCMMIFVWGYKDYLRLVVSPDDAMEIHVTAKKWMWQFEYPKDGVITLGEMVVPVGQPVTLKMSSEDVIHSFFVPNFRIKRDVIPNRYTQVWFEATDVGDFHIFCTEFCGDGHSEMLATLRVVSHSDYQKWLKAGSGEADKGMPLAELGKKLYTSKACNTCHSLDGSSAVGPTWKGLYNSGREFNSGKTGKSDDNYIRESIVNPGAKVVKGFQPIMPSYSGLLSDREINAVIEFIKGISE